MGAIVFGHMRLSVVVLLFAHLCHSLRNTALAAQSCVYEAPGGVGTFDLSALSRASLSPPYYVAHEESRDFVYVYDLCTDIDISDIGDIGVGSVNCPFQRGPAFQFTNASVANATNCKSLGNLQFMTWTLYDPSKPAMGVRLEYAGGDPCTHVVANRSLVVNLLCDDSEDSALPQVEEVQSCTYQVTIRSIHACPVDCHSGGVRCSNAGICAYDTDARRSHCFCDEGRSGDLCALEVNSSSPSSSPATTVLTVLVILLLLTAVAGAVYMFRKLRQKKEQTEAGLYGVLNDSAGDNVELDNERNGDSK